MRVHKLGVAFLAVAALALTTGCTSMSQSGLPGDAIITYRFNDSSVPPQYHRSYDLIIDRDTTRIVVDSYGDVLADTSMPTTDAVWSALSGGFDSVAEATSVSSEPGCTGGTSTSVSVTSNGQTLVDVYQDECGNAPTSDVIDTWIAPARDLFPPMDQLAPETE